MSSAMSVLDSSISRWKHTVLKLVYPEALYKYKEGPTPLEFRDGQRDLIFRICYDGNTRTTQLRRPASPGEPAPETDTIPFPDTTRNFKRGLSDEICGWSLGNTAKACFEWSTLRNGMLKVAEKKLGSNRRHRDKPNPQTSVWGLDAMWCIRGYFIGSNMDSAPPHITVLCSDPDISKLLVDSIHEKLSLHRGWGATRLPKVKLREYGSRSGSPDNPSHSDASDGLNDSDESGPLDKIQARLADNHSTPMMTNENLSSWARQQHRCGIRLEIRQESNVVTKATISGLVKVEDRLYGLTVAHPFSRVMDAVPTAESADTGIDTDAIMKQRSKTSSMEFDWALVDMPGLQGLAQDVESWDDVNLVQTVNGDFRPVLISPDEPDVKIQVALATPGSTHCLRGIFIGSEAIVKIPDSPAPYIAWVLRMEQPWLMRPGDSGSWAFDAYNGNLLGVLIAGCPELHEAYILPAHQIIDHLQTQLGRSVSLPNCHPIGKEDVDSLGRCVKKHSELEKEIENCNSLQQFRNLENKVAAWSTESAAVLAGKAEMPFHLRDAKSHWTTPVSIPYSRVFRSRELLHDRFLEHQQMPRQPPLRLYNFISRGIRIGSMSSEKRDSLEIIKRHKQTQDHLHRPGDTMAGTHLWRHLILGRIDPSANDATINATIEQEVTLMKQSSYSHFPGRVSPWDRNTPTRVLHEMWDNLAAKLSNKRKAFEVSLPEDLEFGTGPSDAGLLFAVVVLNEHKDRLAVLVPPSGYGPKKWSRHGSGLKFSSFRLPFMLGDNKLDETKNVKQLLTTRFNLGVAEFDGLRKLDLDPNDSSFLFKQRKRDFDMVVYEAVLPKDKLSKRLMGRIEWPMIQVKLSGAKRVLAPPFSVAVERSSAIEYTGPWRLGEIVPMDEYC